MMSALYGTMERPRRVREHPRGMANTYLGGAHMGERICSIEDCENPVRARGWCTTHWARWRKHGDPSIDRVEPQPRPLQICAVDDCDKTVHARGWCGKHWKRWWTHGDPLAVLPINLEGLGQGRQSGEDSQNYRHGMSKTPAFKSWQSMHQRCGNPKSPDWKRYGGRGITVCKRWDSFENFLADMGERPEGKTLDRINNDLGYEVSNCRWATPKEQANNRRDSRRKGQEV